MLCMFQMIVCIDLLLKDFGYSVVMKLKLESVDECMSSYS